MNALNLIDLDIPALGYYQFIGSWLYQNSSGTFLVDPGPACTVDLLCEALSEKGVNKLDWILLTHIHLDHAGGVGHLAERFPEAHIACHERAVPHLEDPSKLWAGSLQALGETAQVYGQIKPVSRDRLYTRKHIEFADGIELIDTPGHATHHTCFAFRDLLFVGELFGVFSQLEDSFYLRPATPPKFHAPTIFESMERIAPYTDRKFCFGHYGEYSRGAEIASIAKNQLRQWITIISEHMQESDIEAIVEDLIQKDPYFNRINQLEYQNYQRECFFTHNTISGIYQYLKSAE